MMVFKILWYLDENHSEIKTMMGAGTLNIDETMLSVSHHLRTGMLRNLPNKERFEKAQDNIAITYQSSEPYNPSVNSDFTTLDKNETFAWADNWTEKMGKAFMK
ncbi:hypothetical protein [Psychromonas hadalis]|uniref:hypothetical protein n=1 Tax=Psychromonas hadalis TaxID=211669 RepID=UPI00146F37AB|nr:hypothetical protein [Psychromonas hadalis]